MVCRRAGLQAKAPQALPFACCVEGSGVGLASIAFCVCVRLQETKLDHDVFKCARARRRVGAVLVGAPMVDGERDTGVNNGCQGQAILTFGNTLWRRRVWHEAASKAKFDERQAAAKARTSRPISSERYDAAVATTDLFRSQLLDMQRNAHRRSIRASSPPRKVDRPPGMGGD